MATKQAVKKTPEQKTAEKDFATVVKSVLKTAKDQAAIYAKLVETVPDTPKFDKLIVTLTTVNEDQFNVLEQLTHAQDELDSVNETAELEAAEVAASTK